MLGLKRPSCLLVAADSSMGGGGSAPAGGAGGGNGFEDAQSRLQLSGPLQTGTRQPW